jgi:hypothetical protein
MFWRSVSDNQSMKGVERTMLRIGLLLAALFAIPAGAIAQEMGIKSQWTITITGGAALPTGGEFHQGGSGSVLGLPTSVDSKSNADVFNTGFGWQAGVGYGVTQRVELFGNFAWARAEASELSVGNVASLDLRAAFGDYTTYGMDGGMRLHFMPGSMVSPYVTALAGFRRVEAIPGTFSVPAAGVTLSNVPFFDDSTVPVVGGDVGVLFALSPRIGIGVETGVRYHSKLSEVEGLGGTGLENLNDAGSGWSMPISGVLRFSF